jgi:DNA-binding Xre family transcriptional regulator
MVKTNFNSIEINFNTVKYVVNLHLISSTEMNRIKEVLKQQYRTQKYLVEKTGLSPGIISMYCNNLQQPRLDVLERIAILLDVDVRELIKPSEAK